MYVSREQLEELVDKLNELIDYMEVNDKCAVDTESSTYFCTSEFISFGNNGFLDYAGDIPDDYSFVDYDE